MYGETTVHIGSSIVEVEDNYSIHIDRQSYPRRCINTLMGDVSHILSHRRFPVHWHHAHYYYYYYYHYYYYQVNIPCAAHRQ